MKRAAALLLTLAAVACGPTASTSPTTTAAPSVVEPGTGTAADTGPTTTISDSASLPEPTTTMPEPVEQSGGVTPSVAPPSTRSASSTTIPANSIANGPLPTGDVWWDLMGCETGGTFDPATNTGNGYYGGFQFASSTWWGIGETGYAHQFSYGHQRAAAQRLQAAYGWGQWPTCSRILGLL